MLLADFINEINILLLYFIELSIKLLKHLLIKLFLPSKKTLSGISVVISFFSYLITVDSKSSEISNVSVFSSELELANCKYSLSIFSISLTSLDSLLEISLSLIKANCNLILVKGVLKS